MVFKICEGIFYKFNQNSKGSNTKATNGIKREI